MRQGTNHLEGLLGGNERFSLERPADQFDDRFGQVREVSERFVLDLARLAIGVD